MSIKKKATPAGDRYVVRRRDPTGRQTYKAFRTQKEAERYDHDQDESLRRGTWQDPRLGKITLAQWIEEWKVKTTGDKRQTTNNTSANLLRTHVVPVLGHIPLSKLTLDHLQAWLRDLRTKEVSTTASGRLAQQTVKHIFVQLRTVLNSAKDHGMIVTNPMNNKALKVPRVDKRLPPELSIAQIHRLADAIDPGYRAFVYLGVLGGLRAGEMFGLRWDGVDFDAQTIRVVQQMDGDHAGILLPVKTAASNRVVSMPPQLSAALVQHGRSGYCGGQPYGFVFVTPDGGPIDRKNFYHRVWLPAVKTAGLEHAGTGRKMFTIQDTRHAAAAIAIRSGSDVKVVQNMLGHTSAAITLDTYAHVWRDAPNDAARRIGEFFAAEGQR